jgi:EmrB/QacA subfamily drug resistance transporter
MIDTRQRNVALLVASCFFMQNLDGTIVTTSAKKIGSALHVSPIQISLVITAYLITFAVLIPLGGWMVGRLGTRVVFLGSIVVFTLGSLGCALSTSLTMLVIMRIFQGVGGAMMTPTGRIVALSNIEKTDILRMMSFIVWPGLIAPVVAPLAGSLITTYASWHWIFLINLPLGGIAFLVGLRVMPERARPERVRLDGRGVLYLALGLGGITYDAHLLSISTGGLVSGGIAIVSLIFIAAAIFHLLRIPVPLVSLRLFRLRTFRASNSGITLFMLVVQSVPFIVPLLYQVVFGWSAIRAGLMVTAVFAGNIGIKPATTYILNTFGFRRVLVASTFGVAVSMVLIGIFTATTPIVLMVIVILFSGTVRSMGFTAYMSLGYSDVPEAEMRDANVLASTVQQVGAGLAIAAGAVALRVGGTIADAVSKGATLDNGYTAAFFLLAFVALIACAMAFRLPANAGDSVRSTSRAQSVADEDASAELSGAPATAGSH